MTSGVRLTRRARNDLISIWRYSARTWSPRHADDYIRSLRTRIDEAAQRPTIRRARADLGDDLFAVVARSHVAFIRQASDGIWEVVAVLHAHMDFSAHLKDV